MGLHCKGTFPVNVCFCSLFQLPAPNSGALDMSLQTTLDVKVKKEAPVEVDSSPPDSPDSLSGTSDHSREPPLRAKVEHFLKCFFFNGLTAIVVCIMT